MLENFKRKLQERIEKNAVKIPQISYEDKEGKHTEDIVLKRSKLPYIGDWSRIYPPLDEDGKINWINTLFGGKGNLIKLLIILGIVGMILLAFSQIFSEYEALKSVCVQIQ